MLKKFIIHFLRKLSGLKVGYGSTVNNSLITKKNWLGSNVSLMNSSLGKYTYISDDSRVRDSNIGAFCSIGRNVKIGLGFHPINYLSTSPFLYRRNFLGIKGLSDEDLFLTEDYKSTDIGNDVWIGDNVVIFGGCKINDGVVIGAGSIVTKDLEPYGIYVGVPAKLIKKREPLSLGIIEGEASWWDLSDEEIHNIVRRHNE